VPEKTLGETVREVRESRGLTQAQLAEKAQVALSFVTLLEAGHQHNPSRQVIYRLARALSVPVKLLQAPDE
jgi:transcriptional regulator with XRE-family HTH domain